MRWSEGRKTALLVVVATAIAVWFVYEQVLWPLHSRENVTFLIGSSCISMIAVGTACAALATRPGRLRIVSLLCLFFYIILVCGGLSVTMPLMHHLALRQFQEHRREYESLAAMDIPRSDERYQSIPLPRRFESLAYGGAMVVNHLDGGTATEFLLYRWGIDDSYGLVKLSPGAEKPEGTNLLEKWAIVEPLGNDWYLVQGT